MVSLKTLMPISIFDLDLTTRDLEIRVGNDGESYIFNPCGQSIDLKNLICICEIKNGVSIPICNPIKDSMKTKISKNTKDVVGIIYGSKEIANPTSIEKYLDYFGILLKKHAFATTFEKYC